MEGVGALQSVVRRLLGEFTHRGLLGRLSLKRGDMGRHDADVWCQVTKATEGHRRTDLASLGLLYVPPRKTVSCSGVAAHGELLLGHHNPRDRYSSCHDCSQASGGSCVLGDCRSAERGLADTTVLRMLAGLCLLIVTEPKSLSWLFWSLVECSVGPTPLPCMLWGHPFHKHVRVVKQTQGFKSGDLAVPRWGRLRLTLPSWGQRASWVPDVLFSHRPRAHRAGLSL